MLAGVGVDGDVVCCGFEHGLVERAGELHIGDDVGDCYECWRERGSFFLWGCKGRERERILLCDEVCSGTEVLLQEDGVVGCGDVDGVESADGEESAFVGIATKYHRDLGANAPGLFWDYFAVDVWLEVCNLEPAVDYSETLQRCCCYEGVC